ncbi:MAG TPA: hypothetical protein V6C86_04530 [Oculatellaceae cyanobacterium]
MTAKALLKLTPLLGVLFVSVAPAWAKHHKDAPATNIFTPPAAAAIAPTFNKGKTPPAIVKLLDGTEEPRWDIVKTLPDLTNDQTKALNKLQQETQKNLTSFRTQMNDAQQELKELKSNKSKTGTQTANPAVAFLNPDGKPYMGPLLGTEEMGMDPNEESQEDVQAQIDGLKDKIKEYNQQAATQAKALLTQAQLNELDLMRQGQLVVKAPDNFLVDSPAEPSLAKHKRDRELASNNAGARVLRSILNETARGIRQSQQI